MRLSKLHYHALFAGALVGLCSFYLQIRNTGVRTSTFTKNYAIIDAKYGEEHRKALGPDAKINKYGYPDIGNNLYADLLPYKDWVKVNNAQRAHENLVASMIIFYPSAFIGMLVYPRLTLGLMYSFLFFRYFHMRGYLSFRGYNRAVGADEFSKLTLVLLLATSLTASLNILGLTRYFGVVKKIVPTRLSNRFPSLKYN